MGRRLAVVALMALATAACVAGPNAPTVTPASLRASQSPAPGATSVPAQAELSTLVPWSPATAAPSPVPTPWSWPNGPACRPDQLGTAAALDFDGLGLGGSYSIWNDAAAPCSLSPDVSVSILDANGHALSVSTKIVSLGPICGGSGGQCPAPRPTAPPWIFMPPSAANAQNGGDGGSLTWTNWCGPEPAQPLALLIRARR